MVKGENVNINDLQTKNINAASLIPGIQNIFYFESSNSTKPTNVFKDYANTRYQKVSYIKDLQRKYNFLFFYLFDKSAKTLLVSAILRFLSLTSFTSLLSNVFYSFSYFIEMFSCARKIKVFQGEPCIRFPRAFPSFHFSYKICFQENTPVFETITKTKLKNILRGRNLSAEVV